MISTVALAVFILYQRTTLPAPAADLVDDIRSMFPDAKFRVGFFGTDPILWADVEKESIPVLVWDELPDGSIRIISPPV